MASYLEVMVGTSSCLAITDGDGSGLRICGGKQWGGATTKHKWEITESVAEDIINCLKNDFPSLFGNAKQLLQPDHIPDVEKKGLVINGKLIVDCSK